MPSKQYARLKQLYLDTFKDSGQLPDPDYLDWLALLENIMTKEQNLENSLEYDLRFTDWIVKKIRESDDYSQKLYAALCNNEFQRMEIFPILRDQRWSCSWRYAGGIIAEIKQRGDYLDWYCSGDEGVVDPEIREDLKKLCWAVINRSSD